MGRPSDKIMVVRHSINPNSSKFGGFLLENFEQRELNDRRKQPTPGLSRFSFFGRRRAFRREADRQRGGYIDRYSPGLFFLLLLIVGLNILDALLTTMILDRGGWEMNPFVRSAIELFGERFWAWKFILVSIILILLCIHSKFKPIKTLIVTTGFIYAAVVLYEVFLLIDQLSLNP
jgi:hypothetical protein